MECKIPSSCAEVREATKALKVRTNSFAVLHLRSLAEMDIVNSISQKSAHHQQAH